MLSNYWWNIREIPTDEIEKSKLLELFVINLPVGMPRSEDPRPNPFIICPDAKNGNPFTILLMFFILI